MDPETRRKIDFLPPSSSPNPHPHVEEGRKRYRAGCRCDACRASVAAYQRERRRVQKIAAEATAARETAFPDTRGDG